jgi:hypothetical protein
MTCMTTEGVPTEPADLNMLWNRQLMFVGPQTLAAYVVHVVYAVRVALLSCKVLEAPFQLPVSPVKGY